MGKAEAGTPKAIANAMKAKGLSKLRWYCQMCSKQCRDENGFKCHITSDSHKRQMEIFGQNPYKVIDEYSKDFEKDFLDHLRVTHPHSRVSANVVYNEFIHDRNHIHMNSTKWVTLSEFVKYLGKEGKCKVDDTEKGWFISLIQKDPFEELGDKKKLKRDRAERDEEERHRRMLEEQIARAQKMSRIDEGGDGGGDGDQQLETIPEEGGGRDPDQPLEFSLGGGGGAAAVATKKEAPALAKAAAFEDDDRDGYGGNAAGKGGGGQKRSKLEQLMARELEMKHRQQQQNKEDLASTAAAAREQSQQQQRSSRAWLAPGIIVKVMSKALKEHGYYKQKGVVVKLVSKYIGEIEMLNGGDVVRVDQEELETVIPAPGGSVLVLVGKYQGKKGTLKALNEKKYRAEVELSSGDVDFFEYEDISRLA